MQPIRGEPYEGSTTNVSRHVELLHQAFGLKTDVSAMNALGRRDTLSLLAQEKESELQEHVFTSYKAMSIGLDAVVVEGTHEGEGRL